MTGKEIDGNAISVGISGTTSEIVVLNIVIVVSAIYQVMTPSIVEKKQAQEDQNSRLRVTCDKCGRSGHTADKCYA